MKLKLTRKMVDYKDLLERAMKVDSKASASQILESIIRVSMRQNNLSRAKAMKYAKENLAYYAGYYDDDTRRRVEKFFECEHPFFGSIEKYGPPTPEEAFAMGQKLGERWKKMKP